MMLLRVQELSQNCGLNISQLQKKAQLDMATVRRYWYCTQNGSQKGTPLTQVNVHTLLTLARVLDVSVKDLFNEVR
jgi:Cro/C1-type HTH DNA-binding domain